VRVLPDARMVAGVPEQVQELQVQVENSCFHLKSRTEPMTGPFAAAAAGSYYYSFAAAAAAGGIHWEPLGKEQVQVQQERTSCKKEQEEGHGQELVAVVASA